MSATRDSSTVVRGIRIEPGLKRIRAYLGGEIVADTLAPVLVWESRNYPAYYFPAEDVHAELSPDGETVHSTSRGDASAFTVRAGGREAPGGALRYEDSPIQELRGLVRLQWDAMDAWFEEDEEVFTHPRNPYTRVDILSSSRHVRVALGEETIAESQSPRLLFETGLPMRCYLPRPHVRMDLLQLADIVTRCPYKGSAQAWSLQIGDELRENVAWSYPTPLPESERIAGLMSFYPNKVDVYVDGVLQGRPH